MTLWKSNNQSEDLTCKSDDNQAAIGGANRAQEGRGQRSQPPDRSVQKSEQILQKPMSNSPRRKGIPNEAASTIRRICFYRGITELVRVR
jgi:hypothetical protein